MPRLDGVVSGGGIAPLILIMVLYLYEFEVKDTMVCLFRRGRERGFFS